MVILEKTQILKLNTLVEAHVAYVCLETYFQGHLFWLALFSMCTPQMDWQTTEHHLYIEDLFTMYYNNR